MTTEHTMPKNLTRRATEALHALQQRFMQRRVVPATGLLGHDPRWREQQAERGQREQALFQLRALGWPSA